MSIEIVIGAAAQTNVVSLPANVMLYGGPGVGKSTDACAAFTKDGRCNAFFIPCEDGALKIIAARGMPVPDHPKETVKTWPAMVETISWLAQHRQNYTAVVVDTITTLTTNMYKDFEEKNKSNKNKFQTPTDMRACLFALREWIRALGLHSVFVAHTLAPAVLDGVFHKGGPLLQPKTLIENYFGQIDSVLRVDYLHIPGRPPIRAYFCGGEIWPQDLGLLGQPPDMHLWRVKNREGVNQAVVPADLGAFLRSRNPPYAGL